MFRTFSACARDKGLNFFQAIGLAVPDPLVGDLGRLRQVLTNLIGNAVKFSDTGTVRVSVEPDSQPVQPGPAGPTGPAVRLLFTVKDDGPGIAKERLGEVFEAFSQGGLESQAKYGGTGLGLTISKYLVEMMGGTLRVDSMPGKGSTFSFTAGFGRAEELRRPGAPESEAQPAAAPVSGPLRILLAEDDIVNQLLGQELLKRRGHQVTLAADGREALEKLTAADFDLVLMDVRMPDMSGPEAVAAIRRGDAGQGKARIPVVALTAHALKGDRERFLACGMDDYLSKPIDTDELDRILAQVLAKRD